MATPRIPLLSRIVPTCVHECMVYALGGVCVSHNGMVIAHRLPYIGFVSRSYTTRHITHLWVFRGYGRVVGSMLRSYGAHILYGAQKTILSVVACLLPVVRLSLA